MKIKRKKMNQKMMVLCDCIALEEPLPEGLLNFIQHMSEVCELRGAAYKDLSAISSNGNANPETDNNLFYFWLLHKKGVKALDASVDYNSALLRTEFFKFIEDYCRDLMENQYRLRQSPFFDNAVFEDSMKLIETYYKLDPQLALLTQRSGLKSGVSHHKL
jgi:hypothetical protein